MKRLAAVAVTALILSTTAHAQDNQMLCENIADFSGMVATQRDAGMPLIEMRNQINQADLRLDIRRLFLDAAGIIYMDPEYAASTPNQVRAISFKRCLTAAGR